jgi:uncharacterized membrane protein YhaH (DUF805 family)
MIQYYIKVLQNYVTFKGRARRSEYWYFVLANFLIQMALQVIDGAISTQFLSPLYSLAVLLPSIAVAIRRMHDVGKSGWFALIPIYNIILAATEGTKGPNEYGEDPKGQATSNGALDSNV